MRVQSIPPSWSYLQSANERANVGNTLPARSADATDADMPTPDAGTSNDDTVTSTSAPASASLPHGDLAHSAAVRRLLEKRATTGNRIQGTVQSRVPSRPCKHASVIRTIEKQEFSRLGGITGVAKKYGIPRTTLQLLVDHEGNLRDGAREKLEGDVYTIGHNNLREFAENGRALCAATGGLSTLSAMLGVAKGYLQQFLTPSGKLTKFGKQLLTARTPEVSVTVEIPQQRFDDLLANVGSRKVAPTILASPPRLQPPDSTHTPCIDHAAPIAPSIIQPTTAPPPKRTSNSVQQIVARAIASSRKHANAPTPSSSTDASSPTSTTASTAFRRMQLLDHLRARQTASDDKDPVPTTTVDWRPARDGATVAWHVRQTSRTGETAAQPATWQARASAHPDQTQELPSSTRDMPQVSANPPLPDASETWGVLPDSQLDRLLPSSDMTPDSTCADANDQWMREIEPGNFE